MQELFNGNGRSSRSMSIHIITGATYSLIFLLTLWRYGYMTVHLSFTAAWKTGSLASCLYHIYDHLVVCLPIGILSTNHEVHKLVQQSSSNMRSKQIKSAIIFLIIISWARLFQHHYRQSGVAQCHCIVSEIIIRAYCESHMIGDIIKLGIVRIIPDKLIVEDLPSLSSISNQNRVIFARVVVWYPYFSYDLIITWERSVLARHKGIRIDTCKYVFSATSTSKKLH